MGGILVYGSRDFGLIVRQIIKDCSMNFAGFIDDFHSGPEIVGDWEYVKENFSTKEYKVAIAIGYSYLEKRRIIFECVEQAGFSTITLIHPQSYISNTAVVHKGCIIMAKAVVDMRTEIGAYSVVWPGTVVNHDAVIGSNVFLSPNSTLCGFSRIGDNSFIGAGAIVTDHIEVKCDSFIKAGQIYGPHSRPRKIRR